jgi:hypothetical protein
MARKTKAQIGHQTMRMLVADEKMGGAQTEYYSKSKCKSITSDI